MMCYLHSYMLCGERECLYFILLWDLIVQKFGTTILWIFSYFTL
jgi:hypothetical protein